MIIKYFEMNKKKFDNYNLFLIYGENEGLKKEIIQTLKKKFLGNIENYDETGWVPNLKDVKTTKFLWSIDAHCGMEHVFNKTFIDVFL